MSVADRVARAAPVPRTPVLQIRVFAKQKLEIEIRLTQQIINLSWSFPVSHVKCMYFVGFVTYCEWRCVYFVGFKIGRKMRCYYFIGFGGVGHPKPWKS